MLYQTTKAQGDELETLFYFRPSFLARYEISQADVDKYFEWSEKGLYKEDIRLSHFDDGFNALVSAKKWRGITAHELYEPGVLEGTMPYFVLVEGAPRSVVDFLKKELFQGKGAEQIEYAYSVSQEEKT